MIRFSPLLLRKGIYQNHHEPLDSAFILVNLGEVSAATKCSLEERTLQYLVLGPLLFSVHSVPR